MYNTDADWHLPPAQLALPTDEVHVWRVPLDQPSMTLERFRVLLSEDEIVRADRFYFEHDRRRFVIAHGALRSVLASYLQRPQAEACQLRFTHNAYGKPALEEFSSYTLSFNISHSHNLALFALCCGRQVGVDVEYRRDISDYPALAKRSFSPLEYTTLMQLPGQEQAHTFFEIWTRKEAYIKARGLGLALALDSFDVSSGAGEAAQLLAIREPETLNWTLTALYPDAEYAAALVVEGDRLPVRRWQLTTLPMDGYPENLAQSL